VPPTNNNAAGRKTFQAKLLPGVVFQISCQCAALTAVCSGCPAHLSGALQVSVLDPLSDGKTIYGGRK
jgi:hypothetical protein